MRSWIQTSLRISFIILRLVYRGCHIPCTTSNLKFIYRTKLSLSTLPTLHVIIYIIGQNTLSQTEAEHCLFQTWLPANKGKGLEISGTFSRKNGQVFMELTLTNKALSPMTGFAVQFNKNRWGFLYFWSQSLDYFAVFPCYLRLFPVVGR